MSFRFLCLFKIFIIIIIVLLLIIMYFNHEGNIIIWQKSNNCGRILVAIQTHPGNFETRAVAVASTWAKQFVTLIWALHLWIQRQNIRNLIAFSRKLNSFEVKLYASVWTKHCSWPVERPNCLKCCMCRWVVQNQENYSGRRWGDV